jgi:hypothetical protein
MKKEIPYDGRTDIHGPLTVAQEELLHELMEEYNGQTAARARNILLHPRCNVQEMNMEQLFMRARSVRPEDIDTMSMATDTDSAYE